MNEAPLPRVVVAQKGAREHFLVARALERRHMLAELVVDGWSPAWLAGGAMGKALRRSPLAGFLGAYSPDIPRGKVRSLSAFGLYRRAVERLPRGDNRHAAFLKTDEAFGRRVARLALRPHDVFFGYSYASLECLAAEKSRGVITVLDQIDPGLAEFELTAEEARRWPGYASAPAESPLAYFDRNRREWALADILIVNSEWTRTLLEKQGAPAAKIRVVPLAFDSAARPVPARPPSSPLRVLWLGTVCLRKGIPYLVEAARRLQAERIEFDIVGPLDVAREALAKAPPSMRWLGPVPRSQAAEHYARADVFVLPTISDGFALTQLEAMSYGVPVIATPNCAQVVTDGETGFVVPARHADALADALLRFVRNPGLAGGMRDACVRRAAGFSLQAYEDRLTAVLREAVASHSEASA